MDEIRFRIQDVREAEQSRLALVTAGAPAAAPVPGAPPARVIRHQLGLLRRDAQARARAWVRRKPASRVSLGPQVGAYRPPAVSVLITVYNNGSVLQRAIDSVRDQTMPDWELILWDDGSTDPETLAIVAAAGDRVKKFGGENQGVVGARSSAAGQATGEVLVFLDPDDALDPTYLEKVVLTLARFPSVDVVCPTGRVHRDGSATTYFYSTLFTEKQLAYENTVPISSAMRRRVWDALGGMPVEMADGYEDWAFWRAVAAAGFQGRPIYEALFHYSYSDSSGRDAGARKKQDELERRVKQLNPLVTQTLRGAREDPHALRREIVRRQFRFPDRGRRTLVVLIPWMLRGGGAESFLLSALGALRGELDVVVITTDPVPEGHVGAANEFLEVTPYVYDLASLVGPDARLDMVSSILGRTVDPTLLLIGSPWIYQHLPQIKQLCRQDCRIVDVQFNHIGHLPKLLKAMPVVDEVLVAHRRLQSLLRDYYRVDKPVGVLYIAPPEHDLARYEGLRAGRAGGRLRIGWLGRNSPEKRPDLVAAIAAALPEADFLIAGSGMRTLPPQPENVSVVGWVDDALEFLAGLDFVLNTSDIEGVSVTAMEGLRLGVPVLTRDVGGMAELVRDGVNGLVYDAGQVLGLADRLRDEGLVERVRAGAGSERLPAGFHFDTMLDTLRTALLGPIPMYPDSSAID